MTRTGDDGSLADAAALTIPAASGRTPSAETRSHGTGQGISDVVIIITLYAIDGVLDIASIISDCFYDRQINFLC